MAYCLHSLRGNHEGSRITQARNQVQELPRQGSKVLWTGAHMNGDRRNVCITRTHKGKTYKRYIRAHTEVEIDVY